MRLPILATVVAGLSLTQCQFSGLGLGEDGGQASTSEQSASGTSTGDTGVTPSTTDPDPTTGGGDKCGNAQIDEGEECDNGSLNNGMNGSICKGDCQLNVCGDGYPASLEGCDDGNTIDGDDCSADCKLEGCGDNVLKPPEECDDGNVIDGDGCSSLCKNPFCGDGNPDQGEECDNGQDNLDTNVCTMACKNAVCGDGLLLEGGSEACDDGNLVDGDKCSAECKLESCGDGKVQPGEECDDGNMGNDDACTNDCAAPKCGDGLIQPSIGETCDDGGENGSNKPCTEMCKVAVCGDGFKLPTEECDDGNKTDTDDCLNNCNVAKCGDKVINIPKETCDDGGTEPGDGCSADCKKECGNGVVDLGEQCDDKNLNVNDTCDNSCARLAYYVFVTSLTYPADFGGVEDADMACNTLAAAATLPGAGNFKAWLSSQADGQTPSEQLSKVTKPYILTTNTKIANNWTELTDGDIAAAISITEAKQPATNVNPANCMGMDADKTFVWTNTTPAGANVGDACSNWSVTMGDQKGGVGMLNRKESLWTNACLLSCDKQARLYCVEQPPP